MRQQLFDDVFDLSLQIGILPGFASRVSMCTKSLNNILKRHSFYWNYVSTKLLLWKKPKFHEQVISAFQNTRKCRECGSSLCYKVKTTQNSSVWLCVGCTEEKNGYNELYTRIQVFNGKNVWSHKRKILSNFTLAKKGRNSRHLYWRHEVEKHKRVGKRILPF
tara:strand:+ start:6625 stop:7113 length:489 start_codon:yes stop_codon:yes gene_type:complete